MNDPHAQRALSLRFNSLSSRNGFHRSVETLGVFFQRNSAHDVAKVALKQGHDLSSLKLISGENTGSSTIEMGPCLLGPTQTRGGIRGKGRSIEWDLSLEPARSAEFTLFPQSLRRLGLFTNTAITPDEDLRVSGVYSINGEEYHLDNAPAMRSLSHSGKLFHSWTWGHCNTFVTERGERADFLFEGLTGKAKLLGSVPGPRISTFFFWYQGQPFYFNSAWSSVRILSRGSLTQWQFRADRGDYSFRGQMKAEHRDFAGITFEDTDGSLLYSADSALSDIRVHVYRRGKLEGTFSATGSAAFEVAARRRSQYVPLLI